jgi:hypothetical protein
MSRPLVLNLLRHSKYGSLTDIPEELTASFYNTIVREEVGASFVRQVSPDFGEDHFSYNAILQFPSMTGMSDMVNDALQNCDWRREVMRSKYVDIEGEDYNIVEEENRRCFPTTPGEDGVSIHGDDQGEFLGVWAWTNEHHDLRDDIDYNACFQDALLAILKYICQKYNVNRKILHSTMMGDIYQLSKTRIVQGVPNNTAETSLSKVNRQLRSGAMHVDGV